jgi:hypothetical protein
MCSLLGLDDSNLNRGTWGELKGFEDLLTMHNYSPSAPYCKTPSKKALDSWTAPLFQMTSSRHGDETADSRYIYQNP